MRKLFLLTFAVLAFAACSDDKNNNSDSGLPSGYKYAATNDQIAEGRILNNIQFFGTSQVTTVGQEQTAPFVDKKALFELTMTTQENTTVLYMHATRFAAAMPAVEMRIPALPIDGVGKVISLNAERIIPENFIAATNQWVSNERYAITGIEGRIDDTQLKITFTCAGIFKVTYSGKLIIKAN